MYDVVELMVSYGSAGAPLTREAVCTSCVNLFVTRALVRFAEAGAETKTHSNSDCLVVESQSACRQRESVEPVTAVECRCARSRALLKLSVKADMTTAGSAIIPGLSQTLCFVSLGEPGVFVL